jgi:hypothetical protein
MPRQCSPCCEVVVQHYSFRLIQQEGIIQDEQARTNGSILHHKGRSLWAGLEARSRVGIVKPTSCLEREGVSLSRVTLGEAIAVEGEGIHMTYLGFYQGRGR